jgi:hypothetical protein
MNRTVRVEQLLIWASLLGHEQVVQVLLEKGADLLVDGLAVIGSRKVFLGFNWHCTNGCLNCLSVFYLTVPILFSIYIVDCSLI